MDPNSSAKHSTGFVITFESKMCHQWHTIQLPPMTYYPAANGLARSLQQNYWKITQEACLKKPIWLGWQIDKCLWAYRTKVRTPTKATPFFLVYGCEVVLPLEIQILSLWVNLITRMTDEEKHRLLAPPRVERFRWQISASPITNRALSSPNFQSFQ